MIKKRRSDRFDLQLHAQIKILAEGEKGDEKLEFVTQNISSSGVFLNHTKSLPVGTQMEISIVLPLDQLKKLEGDKVQVTLKGMVIRVEKSGMAICFDEQYKLSALTDNEKENDRLFGRKKYLRFYWYGESKG